MILNVVFWAITQSYCIPIWNGTLRHVMLRYVIALHVTLRHDGYRWRTTVTCRAVMCHAVTKQWNVRFVLLRKSGKLILKLFWKIFRNVTYTILATVGHRLLDNKIEKNKKKTIFAFLVAENLIKNLDRQFLELRNIFNKIWRKKKVP